MDKDNIKIFATPNPKTLKFMPKNFYFPYQASFDELSVIDASNAANMPQMVIEMLKLNFVESIFLNKNFISITRKDDKNWKDFQKNIIDIIQNYKHHHSNADSDFSVHMDDMQKSSLSRDISESIEYNDNFFEEGSLEWQIQSVINQKIRPAVVQDGGDVHLIEFDYNFGIAYVKMFGACVGCPHSVMTLKNGIENLLKTCFSQINAVEAL